MPIVGVRAFDSGRWKSMMNTYSSYYVFSQTIPPAGSYVQSFNIEGFGDFHFPKLNIFRYSITLGAVGHPSQFLVGLSIPGSQQTGYFTGWIELRNNIAVAHVLCDPSVVGNLMMTVFADTPSHMYKRGLSLFESQTGTRRFASGCGMLNPVESLTSAFAIANNGGYRWARSLAWEALDPYREYAGNPGVIVTAPGVFTNDPINGNNIVLCAGCLFYRFITPVGGSVEIDSAMMLHTRVATGGPSALMPAVCNEKGTALGIDIPQYDPSNWIPWENFPL